MSIRGIKRHHMENIHWHNAVHWSIMRAIRKIARAQAKMSMAMFEVYSKERNA